MKKTSKVNVPKKIKKRDGRVVDFDTSRIVEAVFRAFEESGKPNRSYAVNTMNLVLDKLNNKYKKKIKEAVPSIEQLQDFVEEALIDQGFAKVAKAYILYRQKRAEVRREKQEILNKQEIDEVDKKFDPNALRVLKSRYLNKDEEGRVVESPKELFQRVAVHVVLPDILYDKSVSTKRPNKKIKKDECLKEVDQKNEFSDAKIKALVGSLKVGDYVLNKFHIKALHHTFERFDKEGRTKVKWEEFVKMLKNDNFKQYQKRIDDFYDMMVSRNFMPNTPALANFGSYLGMGSACFALDIEDSIESIMETLKKASIVFKSGGGLGYNFSKLRPEGDFIKTTGGTSSGPLSFMRLFDTMTEVVKQGGIRRGANMGIMNSSHPDIEKFIASKSGNKALTNFNISVLIEPDFWDFYKKDKPYPLVNPRRGKVDRFVSPKNLLDSIVYQAWESAEPGVLFHDSINENNPLLDELGPIVTTNPCGELLLYPNESCNLGALNLWNFLKTNSRDKKTVDWVGLERAIRLGVRFLDNIIDINKLALLEIEEMTLKTRKIGLGVMGLGDLLFELGIPYDSQKGRQLMEKIAEFISFYSKSESMELAKEKGAFPLCNKSSYKKGILPTKGFRDKKSWNFAWDKLSQDIKKFGIRNSYTTVIAPTGSTSMIAGCSSGIEPVYSLVYQKNVAVGSFYYIDPVFEKVMLREELFDEALIESVVKEKGSVRNINYIPPALKKFFVVSHDITPENHVKSLASFQKWVDSSISKTINFPKHATVQEMKKAYLLAYELGCKGVTVYRDTSIKKQVLSTVAQDKKRKKDDGSGLQSLKDEKAEGMAVYHDASAVHLNGNGDQENGKINKCPNCKVKLSFIEGCMSCPLCGWGMCS
ncbi:MAG: adenosylcobalamin-dependent ribonucleoside-diphosphate reductase [Candidatus Marinimicrobia bacterium]|nr:adenosylcobalamin-dependent ribonucleoside-diphosphate reductase [Candidatus Neomarinimicrobiota bacterium]